MEIESTQCPPTAQSMYSLFCENKPICVSVSDDFGEGVDLRINEAWFRVNTHTIYLCNVTWFELENSWWMRTSALFRGIIDLFAKNICRTRNKKYMRRINNSRIVKIVTIWCGCFSARSDWHVMIVYMLISALTKNKPWGVRYTAPLNSH